MYIAGSIRNGAFRMYKQRLALGSSRYVYHSRDRQLSAYFVEKLGEPPSFDRV
jgi:hypothetical protein